MEQLPFLKAGHFALGAWGGGGAAADAMDKKRPKKARRRKAAEADIVQIMCRMDSTSGMLISR